MSLYMYICMTDYSITQHILSNSLRASVWWHSASFLSIRIAKMSLICTSFSESFSSTPVWLLSELHQKILACQRIVHLSYQSPLCRKALFFTVNKSSELRGKKIINKFQTLWMCPYISFFQSSRWLVCANTAHTADISKFILFSATIQHGILASFIQVSKIVYGNARVKR